MSDYISRADAIALLTKIVFDEPPYLDSETLCRLYAEEQINTLPSADADMSEYADRLWKIAYERGKREASADAVNGYAEWLEKIIVDNEGANEWLCEDTLDLEWCEKNCHYSSIQAECLRHLYEVSKGGAE